MTGPRTILITGATDGLGQALAHRLTTDGATVLLHGRDQEKLNRTAAELRDTRGAGRTQTLRADPADLAQVRRLAAEARQATNRLDVLVSNAGVGGGEPDGRTPRTSADGYELRFAVNYLAGFLLTLELLPLLRASKPARIVYVASIGQHPLDFADLMLTRGYTGTRAYGQSKLAQITTGFEFASRLDPEEVTVTSLHPSTYMPTKMVLEARGSSVDTLEAGIEATSRLAVDPELEGVTGRFYDRQREGTPDPQASDPDQRKRLWALSLELVGEPEPAL